MNLTDLLRATIDSALSSKLDPGPLDIRAQRAYSAQCERVRRIRTRKLIDKVWGVLGHALQDCDIDFINTHGSYPTVLIDGYRFTYPDDSLRLVQTCLECGHTGTKIISSLSDLGYWLQPERFYCFHCLRGIVTPKRHGLQLGGRR